MAWTKKYLKVNLNKEIFTKQLKTWAPNFLTTNKHPTTYHRVPPWTFVWELKNEAFLIGYRSMSLKLLILNLLFHRVRIFNNSSSLHTTSLLSLTLHTTCLPSLTLHTTSLPSLTLHTTCLPSLTLHTTSLPSLTLHTTSLPSLTLHTTSLPSLTLHTTSLPSPPLHPHHHATSLPPHHTQLTA